MIKFIRASTVGLATQEKFPFFRDAISAAYTGIEPEPTQTVDFNADFTAVDLGCTVVARIVAPGHDARRSPATMRTHPDDSLFVNFSEDTDYVVEDTAGAARVPRGIPRVLDNMAGFTVRFPQRPRLALHTLRLPHYVLGSGSRLTRINAALAETALGLLVGAQFRLLSAAMRLERPEIIAATGRSVEALLLGLADHVGEAKCDKTKPNRTSVRHLKNYAIALLGEPDLTVATIAAAFSCTSRTVQNHFAADGETFSGWLLEERLARAYDLLLDPSRAMRSVETIGFACGFATAEHFHRAFKAKFGAPPGAIRRTGA
jgi:AraC-like DNA-binding protein